MKHSLLTVTLILFFVSAGAQAQSDYRVLPKDFNADKKQQMMRAYLRGYVHNALDQRLTELEAALVSKKPFIAYQEKRRAALHRSLGEMPERSPLNARVTGVITENGFTIEKILFESQPGFHVTANLYRPGGAGPFPAILHPVGHSENGKSYDSYQRANRLLVQNGFVVLCFDPIGQGERKQLIDKAGKPFHRASHEHQELGVAPILLGRSLGSYMVWDGVRAIDYLCSRPDVDPKRIGYYGLSYGGYSAIHLAPLIDRLAVTICSGNFNDWRSKITSDKVNTSYLRHPDEDMYFWNCLHRFTHPELIAMTAPRPFCIEFGTRDGITSPDWTAYAWKQTKELFEHIGHADRVLMAEFEGGHEIKGTETFDFLDRWLMPGK